MRALHNMRSYVTSERFGDGAQTRKRVIYFAANGVLDRRLPELA